MSSGTGDLQSLFHKARKANKQEVLIILSHIGRLIEESDFQEFKSLVNDLSISGTIDISGWTRVAVRALVHVCAGQNLEVKFMNEGRTLSVVRYPKHEQLLDAFIDGILGEPW